MLVLLFCGTCMFFLVCIWHCLFSMLLRRCSYYDILVNALYLYFSTSTASPSLEVLLGPFPLSPPSLLIFSSERVPFLPRLRLVSALRVLDWSHRLVDASPLPDGGGESFAAMLLVDLLLQEGWGCKRRRRGREARAVDYHCKFFLAWQMGFLVWFPATRN